MKWNVCTKPCLQGPSVSDSVLRQFISYIKENKSRVNSGKKVTQSVTGKRNYKYIGQMVEDFQKFSTSVRFPYIYILCFNFVQN